MDTGKIRTRRESLKCSEPVISELESYGSFFSCECSLIWLCTSFYVSILVDYFHSCWFRAVCVLQCLQSDQTICIYSVKDKVEDLS